jgi:hypothetical protein
VDHATWTGQGFAVFGQVVAGFDAVERIFARAEDGEYLKNEVTIVRARRLKGSQNRQKD